MVFVNLLIKPFWVFGIDRVVQNKLGIRNMDFTLQFLISLIFFQILLDFGFQNYSNRQVVADRTKINNLLPSILAFKVILLVFYLIICVAVVYPLGYLNKPLYGLS